METHQNREEAHILEVGSRKTSSFKIAEIRRTPRQRRARETVRAILAAAAEVMAGEGIGRATTNRIAARAGVSIGSLYQYFANKEAILAQLLREHHEDVHGRVEEVRRRLADPGCPLADTIAFVFAEIVALHRRKPALYRLMAQEAMLAEARSAGRETGRGTGSGTGHGDDLTRVLVEALSRRPEISGRDARVSAHIALETIEALARWLVHGVPNALDRDVCAREAVRLVCGYLGIAPATAGKASATAPLQPEDRDTGD